MLIAGKILCTVRDLFPVMKCANISLFAVGAGWHTAFDARKYILLPDAATLHRGSSSLRRNHPCLEGRSSFGSRRGFYHQGAFVVDAKNIKILTSIFHSGHSILKHDTSLYPF